MNICYGRESPHMRIVFSVFLVGLAVLAAEAPAQAYLDPGTGSILLQVLLGGVAAAAVFLKLFWRSLTSPFRRRQSEDGRQS